jgi:hypothetical protein
VNAVCFFEGIPIQLIIYGTISLAICLIVWRWAVSGKGILAMIGIVPYRKYAELKKELQDKTFEKTGQKEQKNLASNFNTEIEILKKIILNSEEFCSKRGYKKQLVSIHPNLSTYLKESIEEYIRNRPDEFTIEVELVNLQKDVNFFHTKVTLI